MGLVNDLLMDSEASLGAPDEEDYLGLRYTVQDTAMADWRLTVAPDVELPGGGAQLPMMGGGEPMMSKGAMPMEDDSFGALDELKEDIRQLLQLRAKERAAASEAAQTPLDDSGY